MRCCFHFLKKNRKLPHKDILLIENANKSFLFSLLYKSAEIGKMNDFNVQKLNAMNKIE